ncbi:MAG: 1-acyl-sn-glycerol-3-phosphate acyltransferase [Aquincola sp.]|nr:1-acyl-sn-glycerol-3-phosphate acyltransferase [Aquincola sp.]MDH5330615.1 1-acyl-sn-glycerol-3-phosphate acyltransferase [Aquincola sp.]
MRAALGVWRLVRVLIHGLHGLAIVLARFPFLPAPARHARIGWWSAKLLRLMGITLQRVGTPRAGAKLLVANHVSWLDIAAIHAVLPEARFVSKADVRQWPLVGRLVAGAGTLFIEREKKRDALRVVHQMAEALKAGDTVAVFPEGTTGDGRTLLPFHANLLQAAIATEAPIQPIVLRFSDERHAVSPVAEFLGDTTLASSLWRFVAARGVGVEVRVLASMATAHADRRALAAHVRETIAAQLPRAT